MNDILKIDKLKKIYHTAKTEILAIDDISFSLKEGEFVAIVGPSGCGKSTLLSILCGLEEKSDGEITFKGDTKIGYMLQQDCLFNWLTIFNNCLLGLDIKKNLNDKTKEHVIELLKTYGLIDFMNVYPSNLSGGMRQRVVCML